MNLSQWLKEAEEFLSNTSTSPRLDCLVLLSGVIKKPKSYILAHPEDKLSAQELEDLKTALKRRKQAEPIAYIIGEKEFYGRIFSVDETVLIPRPESETIIDCLKSEYAKQAGPILDIGTGSGCLAITASLELNTEVDACDISKKALQKAKINIDTLKATVNLFESNLLNNINKKYSYYLANLPYLPPDLKVDKGIDFEPKLALYADNNGLELISQLLKQLNKHAQQKSTIFIEALEFQHEKIISLAASYGWSHLDTNDLILSLKNY